jgi:hypothetical protein
MSWLFGLEVAAMLGVILWLSIGLICSKFANDLDED